MSRHTPRRSSSRSSTTRPRRLAGQRPGTVEDLEAGDVAGADEEKRAPVGSDDVDDDRGAAITVGGAEALASPRTTRILIGVMVVLTVLLLAQGAWWIVHSVRDDPVADVPEGEIVVPDGRPVVMGEVSWREGVDQAAEAAKVIVARDYEQYDAEVDEAAELMTPAFAEEYRQITADIEDEFVSNQTVVTVRVVGQGVVRANQTELQALVFLNQYTEKGAQQDAETTYAPYRAVLTMVHTDEGWLVDDIQTK